MTSYWLTAKLFKDNFFFSQNKAIYAIVQCKISYKIYIDCKIDY